MKLFNDKFIFSTELFQYLDITIIVDAKNISDFNTRKL